jgi:hypothetical protein
MRMASTLPDMYPVEPWTTETFDMLYEYFCHHLRDNVPKFKTDEVVIPSQSQDGDCEDIFWHLTTKDQDGDRLPDPARAARITWVKASIEHAACDEIRIWTENDSKHDKVYIWVSDRDYVVIMKKTKHRHILLTAFPIQYKSYFRKLEKKWQEANK